MSHRPPPGDLLNRTVSRTLGGASALAAAALALGVVAWLAQGGAQPPDRADLGRWLELGSIGVIGLGLLLVTLTPVLQLATALVAFLRIGERREALVTLAVLAILLGSMVGAVLFREVGR